MKRANPDCGRPREPSSAPNPVNLFHPRTQHPGRTFTRHHSGLRFQGAHSVTISSPGVEPPVSAECLQRNKRPAIPPAHLGDSSSRPPAALHAAKTQLPFSNFSGSRCVPGSGADEDRFWFPWLPNPPPVLLSKAPASCFSSGPQGAAVPPGALSRYRWCRPFAIPLKGGFPSSRLGGGPGSAFLTSSQVGSAKAAGPQACLPE